MMRSFALFLALLALLAACDDKPSSEVPSPREISKDSIAEFCHMAVDEMPGPKGQIFVKDQARPFWFASVHDAFAFVMLPDTPKNVVAIYVTDMAKARNWDNPEPGTWVDGRKAVYVIASNRRGSMGENEAVPFSDERAANDFIARYGGRLVRFEEMPKDYILPSS